MSSLGSRIALKADSMSLSGLLVVGFLFLVLSTAARCGLGHWRSTSERSAREGNARQVARPTADAAGEQPSVGRSAPERGDTASTRSGFSEPQAALERLQPHIETEWSGFNPLQHPEPFRDLLTVMETHPGAEQRRWAGGVLNWGLSTNTGSGSTETAALLARAYNGAGALGQEPAVLALRRAAICAFQGLGPRAAEHAEVLRAASAEYRQRGQQIIVWCAESTLGAIETGIMPAAIPDPGRYRAMLVSEDTETREEATRDVIAAFGSREAAVRDSAAAVLAGIGSKHSKATPQLVQMLSEAVRRYDDYMGPHAALALGHLGSQQHGGALEGEALSKAALALFNAAEGPLEQTRYRAALALFELRQFLLARDAFRQVLRRGINDEGARSARCAGSARRSAPPVRSSDVPATCRGAIGVAKRRGRRVRDVREDPVLTGESGLFDLRSV